MDMLVGKGRERGGVYLMNADERSPGEEAANDAILGSLTRKQRDVLDLLIQHKTSKEISRLLGISPHTVDQRIMLARAKLQVATRGEVAQAYRQLVSIYEQPVYGLSHVDEAPASSHLPDREDAVVDAVSALSASQFPRLPRGQSWALTADGDDDVMYYRVLPEMFDGPYGTVLRLGAIVAIAMFLILVVLGGLTLFAQLSTIFDY